MKTAAAILPEYLHSALLRVQACMESAPPPEPGIACPPLEVLEKAFGLSAFERDVLLLAAGWELDAAFAAAVRRLTPAPTFAFAAAHFPSARGSVFSPQSPLRRWRLAEPSTVDSILHSPLRVDERVLHFLTGTPAVDDRLEPLLHPLSADGPFPQDAQFTAVRTAQAMSGQASPLVQVCGAPASTRRTAAAVAVKAGLRAVILRAAEMPAAPHEREAIARLMEREILFSALLPVLDIHGADAADAARAAAFAESLAAPLLLLTAHPLELHRPFSVCELPAPDGPTQRGHWQAALGSHAAALNGTIDRVVRQFQFDSSRIARTAARFAASPQPEKLWQLCREEARPDIEPFATRISSRSSWDDLILPAPQMSTLRELAAQAAHRHTVYEDWGFSARSSRGLGLAALFSGPSGTGKTLAAEVIAAELRLDLYRIDLSATVSKWLGETEKNLARIFDAAEAGGAILLFDEADALFGRRSEVKDARDRYANVEVSYLLQRMEAYRGLAILTTNQREALDTAFLRRLRFVVHFPLPEAPQRRAIWERVFPSAMPRENLQPDKLARLTASGGAIRNIALNAAFAAAAQQQPVRMSHLLAAAKSEAAKTDRTLNSAEVADWT